MCRTKHRHILDTVCTLLISAKCPERFWGEAAFTAVYTINQHPTPILNNKSPYEVLHGVSPAYELLKVWGSACFVQLQSHERTKLEPRSRLCCFLGYGIEHKGYRCWNPISQRLHISRQVSFWEYVPFSYISKFRESPNSTPPFTPFFTDASVPWTHSCLMSDRLRLLFHHLLSLSLLQSLLFLHRLPLLTSLITIKHLFHLHNLHPRYLLNL